MTSIGSLPTAATRLTLALVVLLGGCYTAHQHHGDGGASPPLDGAVDPTICEVRRGAEIFDVIALTPGTASVPHAIDGAGRVYGLAAIDDPSRRHAFRWDPGTGAESLDDVLGVPRGTIVAIGDVARDGAIAGTMRVALDAHAFVWTSDRGLEDLSLEEEPSTAAAFAPDGTVLVNAEHRASLRAPSAMVPLGLPPGADPRAVAIEAFDVGASGDVVGTLAFDRDVGGWHAFRRGAASGYELLESLGVGRALAISDDGRIIVGASSSSMSAAPRPVMWIDGALSRLPLLDEPGITQGEARDVSASGVIIGTDSGSLGAEPSLGWLRVGIRKIALDALLTTGEWHVLAALVITDDHQVLALARRSGSAITEGVLLSPRCVLDVE